jgi:hypothetical protein
MTLQIWKDGGFVAEGTPTAANPRDWYAWHFTRLEYLPEIIAAGELRCDDDVPERVGSLANAGIKEARKLRDVAAEGYPLGRSVSSHVPFYIAARSPMLKHAEYNSTTAVLDGLVFFGVKIGDIIDAGLDWAASDGNARTAFTRFASDIDTLGTFVDFELLTQKWWKNIPEDMDRKRRRQAEILVHERVPLGVVSVVVARTDATVKQAEKELNAAGFDHITYKATNVFFN